VDRRRRLLSALVVATGLLAAALLWDALGTVFFAVTVAFVAEPVYRRLLDRGVPEWWASGAVTTGVFGVGVLLVAPFVVVLYQRRTDLFEFLRVLPSTLPVQVGPFVYVVEVGEWLTAFANLLRSLAVAVVAASPALAIKATLFGVLVFALLVRGRAATRTLLAAVPAPDRDVALRLGRRCREALVAIYVLQAATALATFLAALVVFWALGYPIPVALALLAGLLQFVPVVGPSVLVAVLVGWELFVGDATGAALVATVGWLFVAFLPDVVVRPRLAERTARIPGSLYFVGFTGGALTVGPVGVIAGPVVVVLFAEALSMLSGATPAAAVELD
jgi:predicted PurR-regulated permease PerM